MRRPRTASGTAKGDTSTLEGAGRSDDLPPGEARGTAVHLLRETVRTGGPPRSGAAELYSQGARRGFLHLYIGRRSESGRADSLNDAVVAT